jgi:hypothetical protein
VGPYTTASACGINAASKDTTNTTTKIKPKNRFFIKNPPHISALFQGKGVARRAGVVLTLATKKIMEGGGPKGRYCIDVSTIS